MPIAYVQSVQVASGFASSVSSPGMSTTNGNLLIANQAWPASTNWTSVTDTSALTWSNSVAEMSDGGAQIKCREEFNSNITGNAAHVVILTLSGNTFSQLAVTEVSGQQSGSVPDEVAVSTHLLNTSHPTASTATTAQAAEYLHGMAANTGFRAFVTTSPWIEAENQAALMIAYQIVAAVSTYAFVADTPAGLSESAVSITTWLEAAGAPAGAWPLGSRLLLVGAG